VPSSRPTKRRQFQLFLIRPSHYDDDGYVIQWLRSVVPANSLASLYGLALDCQARGVLGDDVELVITAYNESNTRIRPERIVRAIRASGGLGLVGFVGVQSNQFPRAVDLARPLRAAGIQVCIGGFHVSGCLAMLPEMQDDLKEALALGISLFAGEAEGRLDSVLRDALAGRMQPIYNYMDELPPLEDAVLPILPAARIGRSIGRTASFDAGRGCPFQCSFCTIINVQGRKSRYRSADDVEAIIRSNLAQGVDHFFITDDNFARNRNWEAIFDRLIEMREREGVFMRFVIQVDTLCHKLPNFIEKAARAGVLRVFIGLENINPENLLAAKKRQNHIDEYRTMMLEWKRVGCYIYAGFITGFPSDTPETIVRDIKIIQRELPVDLLEFFYLTPLPGSEDHKRLWLAGAPLDPDMNKYDLEHVCTTHPKMSKEEWERAYRLAWKTYYTPEHMETVMRRAVAKGMSPGKILFLLLWFSCCLEIEGVHPLEGGLVRIKVRKDRRPGLPIESAFSFYPRYLADLVVKYGKIARLVWRLHRVRLSIKRDPKARDYMDTALTPASAGELDVLELYQATDAARAATAKAKREAVARAATATATA